MGIRFTRRVHAEGASPDLDPVFDADGRYTADSLARIRTAAKQGHIVSMANLGIELYATGNRAGAFRWLGKAWDAGNVPAGFNLGTYHLVEGAADRAQAIWEKCAELGDADAMLGLVRLALERGEPASAGRWVDAVYAQDDAFPITAMGVAFAGRGRIPQAVKAFRRAVELGDAYAMEYLAAILDRQGLPEEAEALRINAQSAERML